MREIKFRAWDGEKIQGIFTIQDIAYEGNGWSSQTLENLVFIQYTGLKDSKGVEIYEGDVCKNRIGQLYEIVYGNGRFGGAFNGGHYRLWRNNLNWEVIGNIYEHPHLLERENGLK